jgi:hypothetical protein
MKRIYPDHLPVVADEPRWEDFCVLDVDDQRGQGVLVLRDFPKGSRLFRMNGTLTTEMTLHSLQMEPGLHLDDPYFAGKVLHSCSPNSKLDPKSRLFRATRKIAKGELLTMDYDETEDILFRAFMCCCGSPNCRGYVAGKLAEKPRQTTRRVGAMHVIDSEALSARLYFSVLEERESSPAVNVAVAH